MAFTVITVPVKEVRGVEHEIAMGYDFLNGLPLLHGDSMLVLCVDSEEIADHLKKMFDTQSPRGQILPSAWKSYRPDEQNCVFVKICANFKNEKYLLALGQIIRKRGTMSSDIVDIFRTIYTC